MDKAADTGAVAHKSKGFEAEEVILHISDVHFGEKVESEHNIYNTAIARARMAYYFDKVIRIGRDIYGRVIPIRKVHIFLTGDSILNETMRGSQKMSAELNFVEQIAGAADMYAENIANLLMKWKSVEELHIYGVPGNHGRAGKPGENDPAANYDRQVYDRLRLVLDLKRATTPSISGRKVVYHFPRRGETVVGRVAGHTVVAHHAHGVKSQFGIPYYGLMRLRDRLYKMFKGKMDVLLVGHFHRGYSEFDGTVDMRMSPSLIGWDDFTGSMGYGHYAAQNFYMLHPKHGITVERRINVGHIQKAAA